MNSRLSQRSFRTSLIVTVILLACATLVVLEKTSTTDFVKMPKSAEQKAVEEKHQNTVDEQKATQDAKEAYLDSAAKNTTPDTQPTEQAVAPAENKVSLTAKQDGSSVTVLTKLVGVSTGTCTLKIQNGASNTTQTAPVMYQPEFSSCAGFSVPTSSVDRGNWQITVVVTSDTNATLSQTITQEVK